MEREYVCKKINENIMLDGNYNKEVWKSGEEAVLCETASGAEPDLSTKVKALWNDEYLYIAFQCQDDEVHCTMKNYNDPLYLEDVVEVFIDDNRDLKTYIEIEVNPFNALLHYGILNDLEGNAHGFAKVAQTVKTAVSFEKERNQWSAEIEIPLKEFVTAPHMPPRSGDAWLVNFYRIDRKENGKDEYSAWSSTGKINFHMPQQFGKLIFAL